MTNHLTEALQALRKAHDSGAHALSIAQLLIIDDALAKADATTSAESREARWHQSYAALAAENNRLLDELAARPVAQADAGAADDLVKRLRNTPNWRRESYGSWKDCVTEYDRAPFEAADEIERLTRERDAAVSAHEAAVRAGFSFRGRVIELSGEKARLQEALAASAQATQAVEPVAWQSIETAPKDGRTLLLGYFNQRGMWRTLRGEWFSRAIIDEQWENVEDCEEGWYETPVESDEEYLHKTEPTHWMALPGAPGTHPASTTAQEAEPARKPLTEAHIWFEAQEGMLNAASGIYATKVVDFARAIERAHGIHPATAQEAEPHPIPRDLALKLTKALGFLPPGVCIEAATAQEGGEAKGVGDV